MPAWQHRVVSELLQGGRRLSQLCTICGGFTLRAAVWQEVFYKSFDFGYSVVFTIA